VGAPTPNDVHYRRPLSNIAIGYRNPDYLGAKFAFPEITVQKQSDLYWIFTKGAWFRDIAAPRAPGTRAKEADYYLSTGSYMCLERALSHVVPDEVRKNADNPLKPDRDATTFVTDLLMLGQEIRIADLISTNGSTNWANSTSPATQWDNDASDPLGDVETGIETLVQNIAREPNKAIIGRQVWTKLKNHPDLLDRIKGVERGVMTIEIMQGLMGIPKIAVGKSIKNTGADGASDSFSFVWGKNMVMLWSPDQGKGGLQIPSAGYVFGWMPFETRKFRREEEFSDVVMVRHSVDERITASDAGYIIYKSVS
jgi:hypothetical protein